MQPEPDGMGLAMPGIDDGLRLLLLAHASVMTMTAGTIFLMWLGEQIDEYGIGNGISLIIMAGIVARIPDATGIAALRAGHGNAQGVALHPRRRDRRTSASRSCSC